MSEPIPELLPTVTLQHRFGEQRLLVNRADYIAGRDRRFRNWLLADGDPALAPPPLVSLGVTPAGSAAPEPARSEEKRRRGRRGRGRRRQP